MTMITPPAFDVHAIRQDFPILQEKIHGKPLTYLDSAASAQKPQQVLDALHKSYATEYANVHRGAYYLSETATAQFEQARRKVQAFINAKDEGEIIFTRGATEGINLVAYSFGDTFLQAGDEILITELEHHSNIVPWQLLRDRKGITLSVVPVRDDGSISAEDIITRISPRTKLVAMAHVSNALGTVLPVKQVAAAAHAVGAKLLVDGCQGVVHGSVDMQDLDCDFYVFSGHKLYGPTGIGVLYGKADILNAMPPFHGGGDMIETVSFERSTWAPLPAKFEAGTPAIVQAIGLGAAVDYVAGIGMDAIAAYENSLLQIATRALSQVQGLRIIGQAAEKVSVISFALDGVHPHDLATYLDRHGIAVRAGHHCAQPVMQRFGVSATTRASFGIYNTQDDIETLVYALNRAKDLFA
jgi:cysteine desulfurase/selenocysteine lyase